MNDAQKNKFCPGDNCKYYYCITFKKCIWDNKSFKSKPKRKHVPKKLKRKKKTKLQVKPPKNIISTAVTKRVRSLINRGHKPNCLCCDTRYNLTFDHVIPISKGGSNKLENGQILCLKCNELKADELITIEELKIRRNKVKKPS